MWILSLQLFHLHFFLLILCSLQLDIGIFFFFQLPIYLFLCYNQLGESYHIGPLGAHAASLVAEEPERVHVAV